MFLWLTNHHKNPLLNRLFMSVQLNLWLWITLDHDFPNTSPEGNSNEWKLYHRTLLALESSYAVFVYPIPMNFFKFHENFFIAAFVTRRITPQIIWQPDPIRKMIIIFIFYYFNGSTFKINVERWKSIWWWKFKYGHFSR